MSENHRVDFVELPAGGAAEMARTKAFYQSVFGWVFKDWGENYADTQSSGVSTGINADASHKPKHPLVILYSSNLEETLANVTKTQSKITKEVFSFPGGRRFHFLDPAGNELAVWSDR